MGPYRDPMEPYGDPMGPYRDPVGPYRDPMGPYRDPMGIWVYQLTLGPGPPGGWGSSYLERTHLDK